MIETKIETIVRGMMAKLKLKGSLIVVTVTIIDTKFPTMNMIESVKSKALSLAMPK